MITVNPGLFLVSQGRGGSAPSPPRPQTAASLLISLPLGAGSQAGITELCYSSGWLLRRLFFDGLFVFNFFYGAIQKLAPSS